MRALVLLLLMVSAPAWGKPLVVTTIRPLTLIAEEIAGSVANVRQMLPDTDTEHHYSLRVSDRQLLDQADLVVWVGPGLEHFLASSLLTRTSETVITAAQLPAIVWPSADTQRGDYHLWLNPDNAVAIARAISAWLSVQLPEDVAQLNDNLRAFEAAQYTAADDIRAGLKDLTTNALLVDHDAFGHFVDYFGLYQAGALRGASGLPAGARELQYLLALENVRCVVAEPRHRSDRVRRVAERLGAKVVVIDPLGGVASDQSLPESTTGRYAEFMRAIGAQLADCLKPAED